MKKHISVIVGVILLLMVIFIIGHHQIQRARTAATASQHTPIVKSSAAPQTFNKTQYSLSDPTSIWVVVNKQRPLSPKTYVPALVIPSVRLKGIASAENMHVASTMAGALQKLFAAASSAGYPLMLSSGYRSYNYQVSVHSSEVTAKGQVKADQESARPGYSEHQTGLAADVAPISGSCDLSQCFGTTPTGQWLAANAYRYGFIIRYPQGKEQVTGYEYEPWHVRYVGIDLAAQMHKQNVLTLEEFFDLPAAPSY